MATQTLRPATDVTTTDWSAVPVLSGAETYSSRIGEITRNDATYIESIAAPTSLIFATELGLLEDPGAGLRTGYQVAYVLSTAGGATSSTFNVSVRQPGVAGFIAEWNEPNVPAVATLFTRTLTDAQIATIDYTLAIRLRFTVTVA